MRVALVNNLYVDQLGYFYIASTLKEAGHDVRFFLTTRRLEAELRAFDPQLVGMTAVTGNHQWAANTAWEVKQFLPRAKTILGGPHPTYHPQILRHEGLDYVCRGEGEVPIRQLCQELERGGDTFGIPGIDAKDGDRIYDNGFAQLVESLDDIPFPDRSMYQQFSELTSKNHYPFMLSSRGCPFKCTFCYAPTLARLTKEAGKFVRFRSVDNVIAEALELRQQFNPRSVEFVDDIFGMSRSWLAEFASRWKADVGLPFQCNLRADLVDENAVDLLASAGCVMVAYGVESGSQRVRNDVLQKEVSTEQIERAARLLKSANIKVVTYNIVGAPTETWDETLETLRLNQRIKPDYAQATIMMPYPGTEAHDFAVKKNLLDASPEKFDEMDPFVFASTPLKLPHAREIANLQKMFFIGVRFPRLTPVLLRLARLPENLLFYALFVATHTWAYHRRIKKVPSTFLFRLLLNCREILRRHRSGLYKQRVRERLDAPRLKERIESGAGF